MKKMLTLLLLLALFASVTLCCHAVAPLLADEAELLLPEEEIILLDALSDAGEALGMDIVVVTADSLDGKTVRDYADDWYDYNGYRDDGVLLLISMSTREWYISTSGNAIPAITGSEIDDLGNRMLPYLSSGDYIGGFLLYAEQIIQCAEYTESDSGFVGWLVCFGIGIVVGLISVMVMKFQMKSVRKQNHAGDYMVGGSFDLTRSHDIFLYSHVSRVAIQQSNSTHRGSSGRSHGGGGGRF